MVWDHFSHSELQCRCGCGLMNMDDKFMTKIVGLRKLYGKSMYVTSATRCSAHNSVVSSTGKDGPHTTGRAIDIAVSREDARELVKLALVSGLFTGIGLNQKGNNRFVHLDDLDGPDRLWSY